jgi:hypothetical protein
MKPLTEGELWRFMIQSESKGSNRVMFIAGFITGALITVLLLIVLSTV